MRRICGAPLNLGLVEAHALHLPSNLFWTYFTVQVTEGIQYDAVQFAIDDWLYGSNDCAETLTQDVDRSFAVAAYLLKRLQ